LHIAPVLAFFLIAGCVGESPTVIPDPASQEYTGTAPGTSNPQLTGMYPENLDTNIPVDADIVLVFSKPINTATVDLTSVSITDGVTPVTAFSVSSASGGRTIIIDITAPAALSYGATYTVSLTTDIEDTEVPPNSLDAATSWTFTTASSTASVEAPRVINGTQYPSGTGVSIDTDYAEVTFTRAMTWPDAVMWDNLLNFTITPDVSSGISQVTDRTYRLDLTTPLSYGTPYSVKLNTNIEDAMGTPLVEDGNEDWSFTTESNPVPGAAPTVSSVWIESVDATSAKVSFTTSKPIAREDCYVLFDTASVTLASTDVQEFADTTLTTVHTVTIGPLQPSTRYYIQAGLDTDSNGTVDYLSGTDIVVYTKTDGTINHTVSAAAGNQDGFVLVQNGNGTGYAFWVDGGANIFGKYFTATSNPAGLWGANGTQVNTVANTTKVIAINDGFNDTVAVYQTSGNALYARDVYNSGVALAQKWAETSLGITVKAGSAFSACLVHERPTQIATGAADMPDNGAAANLLYDRDVDFSGIAFLDVNDVLADSAAGTAWISGAIENQGGTPYSTFKYVLKSTAANPNLAALTNYYILDADTVITGTADSGSTATQIRSSTTNLLPVSKDDIIHTSNNEWGIAAADGAWDGAGYWYVNVDRAQTPLVDSVGTFTIYTTYSGPHTSEAVINPFWDNDPVTPFNPGVTVLEGDYVVNTTSNPAKASTVATIVPASDSDYALRLDTANILLNAQNYTIARKPASSTYKSVGYSTSTSAHTLIDASAAFAAGNIGDTVWNLTAGTSAMITAWTNASTVSLSADVFTAVGQRYMVYTKRGFLVAYIDTNDFVLARSFNMADGSPLGAVFAVQTSGVNSNPVAVSDGAGNAIILYERGGDIFGRKVSATGSMLWAGEQPIINMANPCTIVQALPDRATGGAGGAYVLAADGSGNIRVARINGTNGSIVAGWPQSFTGYDPHMVSDSDVPNPNRVIITYRNTHVAGGGTYYHIEARAYTSAGALSWTVNNVSDNTAQYHCEEPRIALADTGTGASGFYVSWFDGRYMSFIGYSLYVERFTAAGGAPGALLWPGEVHVTSPNSFGYTNALLLGLLTWDDNIVTAPYGVIPIWLDYRGVDTDIYYDNVGSDGSF